MLKSLTSLSLLVALLAGCGNGADAPQVPGADDVTVITGARLIDGNGGPPVENAVIVIRGDRFESVGPEGTAIPEGAEVIDLTGKTIMPGIISVHNHLSLTRGLDNNAEHFNESNIQDKLNQYARYGVLHETSMGTDKPNVFELVQRQRAGEIGGARMYTAGRGFGVEGGYPPVQSGTTVGDSLDVNRPSSEAEIQAAVAANRDSGADFIKLWVDHHFETMPRFPPELYRPIVQEARNQGMRPVAHIHTLEDAHGLVDAGVVGLIHSVRDQPVDQSLIQKMTSGNIFSVSTLAREESMFIYAGRAPYLDDPFFTEAHDQSIINTLASPEFQAPHINNPELGEWRPALATAQQNLKTLFDAGVKIGFGSDSGPVARFEGYFEHREMELMQEAGLTPAQIIQIASRNSAEILGIDADYGTIEAGKMAEFLVLGANPLDNISNTKTLEQVWQRGRPIDR